MKRRRPTLRIATKGTTSGGGGAVRSSDDVPLARASAPLGEKDVVVQSGDCDGGRRRGLERLARIDRGGAAVL